MKNRETTQTRSFGWHLKVSFKILVFSLAAFLFVEGLSLAASTTKPAIKSIPDFERMKSLVGEWQGRSAKGTPAQISYSLVSDNSALMERLTMGKESEMITMYHPDGARLMMTHYCSAHNQPRMRAEAAPVESKSIVFNLLDITNLSAPDAGHMKKLVVTFDDKDHFTQEWTWSEKGKEGTEVIHYERKR